MMLKMIVSISAPSATLFKCLQHFFFRINGFNVCPLVTMRSAIVLLVPALVAATPIDFETGKPDGDLIKIIGASTSGNGCPQGTVTTDLSPDGTVGSWAVLTDMVIANTQLRLLLLASMHFRLILAPAQLWPTGRRTANFILTSRILVSCFYVQLFSN